MRSARHSITGLYAHVPFCDGKCGYCAFYSVRYESVLADRYLDALQRELAAALPLAPKTIYIGGGTPSVLSVRQLEDLGRLLRDGVATRRLTEWTIEINPGSLDAEKAAVLAAAGVNRFSLGAQAFDDRVLKALGRRHAAADIFTAIAVLRRAGIENIGLDLIACVPGCGRPLWRSALRQAVALAPKHISVYALTSEEGARLDQAVRHGKAALLSDEEQLAMLDTAEDILVGAGYRRYEISNYAKPGFECRHNLACWRGEEYIGLGPAAASHVGLKRWTNRADLPAYLEAVQARRKPPWEVEQLTPALKRQERVIFGLRMAEGIADSIAAEYKDALERLQADGLVMRLPAVVPTSGRVGTKAGWVLTARGRNLADYAAVELIR